LQKSPGHKEIKVPYSYVRRIFFHWLLLESHFTEQDLYSVSDRRMDGYEALVKGHW